MYEVIKMEGALTGIAILLPEASSKQVNAHSTHCQRTLRVGTCALECCALKSVVAAFQPDRFPILNPMDFRPRSYNPI